jgi:regulator of protease activity HflC (stomatin/prohibitin superfamily)
MRDILNQVVTAEKQSQANLIRRREGTAATRSLLNTVKLMEDNPLIEHGDLLHLLGHLLRLRRFAEPGG